MCHHRRETDEDLSVKELISMGLYYNRPASELIFMEFGAHSTLHRAGRPVPMEVLLKAWEGSRNVPEEVRKERGKKIGNALRGKPKSEEHCKHLSEALRGKPSPSKGVPKPEGTGAKISAAKKGVKQSEEHRKHNSECHMGTHWYNNGIVSTQCRECPPG